jgi:hypothetical protein
MNVFHIVLVLVSTLTGQMRVMQSQETWPTKTECEAMLPNAQSQADAYIAARPDLQNLKVVAQVACFDETQMPGKPDPLKKDA